MKQILLTILMVLSNLPLQAQTRDELKILVSQDSLSVEVKINYLIDLTKKYRAHNLDSALIYAGEAKTLATSLNNNNLLAKTRINKASVLYLKREFVEANKLLQSNILDKNLDSLNIALTYLNIGNIYNGKQENNKAITYYLKATKVFETYNDSSSMAKAYGNIGTINAKIGNHDKALEFLEKSLLYIGNDQALKLQITSNVSAIYGDKGNYIKAIEVNKEAEQIALQINSKHALSAIYSNMCNQYRELKDYTISIEYGQKSLGLKKELGLSLDVILNNIGYSYLLNKEYNKAIISFQSISLNANRNLRALVLNNLKNTYQQKGNKDKALEYANAYIILKDSLNKVQQSSKVADLSEKYESDKKQQQIDLLNINSELQQTKLDKQRNLFIGIGSFLLLSLLLIYFWYKNQKTRQVLQNTSLQHKLLQTQLNPHFLFHALNSIQTFIYQNKKEESISYLSSYSKLMRSILESSEQDFISVVEDSNAIKEYLNLQKLNFPEDVSLNVKVDSHIEVLKIPPMFIQPFVENALVHGISSVDKGTVLVHYTKQDDKLNVVISDNGKGIDKNGKNNTLHRSMGSEIIKNRVFHLKQMHKYDVKINHDSNNEGTRIVVQFPLKSNTFKV